MKTQQMKNGFMIFLFGVCVGNSQCVDSLLSHGADPNHQVLHVGSPLYVSCVHQHTACSKILLARGVCWYSFHHIPALFIEQCKHPLDQNAAT